MLSPSDSPDADRFLSGMSVCLSLPHSLSTPLGCIPGSMLDVVADT